MGDLRHWLRAQNLEQYAGAFAANDIDLDILLELRTGADGVPLFVEELTRSVVEAGEDGLAVPTTLADSLMARLVGYYLAGVWRLRGLALLARDRADKGRRGRHWRPPATLPGEGAVLFARRAEAGLAEIGEA
jgi:hypothetical protein